MDAALLKLLEQAPTLAYGILISILWIFTRREDARAMKERDDNHRADQKAREEASRLDQREREGNWRTFLSDQRELDRALGKQQFELLRTTSERIGQQSEVFMAFAKRLQSLEEKVAYFDSTLNRVADSFESRG